MDRLRYCGFQFSNLKEEEINRKLRARKNEFPFLPSSKYKADFSNISNVKCGGRLRSLQVRQSQSWNQLHSIVANGRIYRSRSPYVDSNQTSGLEISIYRYWTLLNESYFTFDVLFYLRLHLPTRTGLVYCRCIQIYEIIYRYGGVM